MVPFSLHRTTTRSREGQRLLHLTLGLAWKRQSLTTQTINRSTGCGRSARPDRREGKPAQPAVPTSIGHKTSGVQYPDRVVVPISTNSRSRIPARLLLLRPSFPCIRLGWVCLANPSMNNSIVRVRVLPHHTRQRMYIIVRYGTIGRAWDVRLPLLSGNR